MRRSEIRIIKLLAEESTPLGRLAEKIGMSQSWTSRLVDELESDNLVEKGISIKLADTYEAHLLVSLSKRFSLEKVLAGKREEILKSLFSSPKTITELENENFSKSTIYDAMNDLREIGVVSKENGEYRITDEELREVLKVRSRRQFLKSYSAGDEKIIKTRKTDLEGEPTAFSAFTRYGVLYRPSETYLYRGGLELGIEKVLIHAMKFTENKKQMAVCAVFYLKHRSSLKPNILWKEAGRWDCLKKFADMLAYLDRREVKESELFLPWDEFIEFCEDYDVYPNSKYPGDVLVDDFKLIGDVLSEEMEVYLIGGGNLILRGLKDSTKDIDIVLEDDEDLNKFVSILGEKGYEEKTDLGNMYERLGARLVMEKTGHPRWDIFVEQVAGSLYLTEGMKSRVSETRNFGDLKVHLISLTDILLLKAVTDREGDIEDAALIMEQGEVEWDRLLEEIKRQEKMTERYFSFTVLTALDILKERYNKEAPMLRKLSSYCLEKALLLSLEEEKTIKGLKDELDFPSHQIYNKLRKFEDEGYIEVDREGKLNKYRRTYPED